MKLKSMLIVFLGLSSSCLFAQCCQGSSRTALVAPRQSVEKVENTLPQLLEFGSKRCMACQKMAPIIEALTNDYKGVLRVEFIDVAIREKLVMAHQHKIKTIPTQVFLDAKGKELWRHEGFISREDIEKKWKSLGYDLTELKKKVAEKSTPQATTAQ
jgi:thioredoxin 1